MDEPSTEYKPNWKNYSTLDTHQSRERILHRDKGRFQIDRPGLVLRCCLGQFKDCVTTLLDASWCWIIFVFCTVYVVSWTVFAAFWFALESGNGRCVSDDPSFQNMFLFSIETQVTIGYGGKFVSSDCYLGIPLLMLQCLVGLILDSLLLGLVFAKVTHPGRRGKSILFSDNAVIHDEEDGKGRVLEFRIYNLRQSQLVEAHVRLYLYRYRKNTNGEDDLHCYDLDVGFRTGRDRVFFITPVTVRHYINESSPLHDLSSESIRDQDLEIVVVLEAIIEATGLTTQVLWSYTGGEILADHRFLPMVSRRLVTQKWVIDSRKINDTVRVQIV